MAYLTPAEYDEVVDEVMEQLSDARESCAFGMQHIRSAAEAAGDKLEAEQVGMKTTLPADFRVPATSRQIVELYLKVIKKKWNITPAG